ncbi:kinase-like protein [Viridothelium virens]|uniref:non-specific serine/threonine protein kinase n=1 Tax=Viridothelium virens TaxID=1048519 RepID=A0A6A6HFY6_VIRVR|nr:kinase-like protein [Viridothelium virens]
MGVSANTSVISSKVTDEDHDQIGSQSSTPPGAATPRPDPTDKRLPGILHSYFGQVGDSSYTHSKPVRMLAPLQSTNPTSGTSLPTPQMSAHQGGDGLPTAPSSARGSRGEDDELSPLLPHERLMSPQQDSENICPLPTLQHALPTPPTSSSSSLHKASRRESREDDHGKDRSERAKSVHDRRDQFASLPLRLRRHTYANSSPLTKVVKPTVHAHHISNPATCTNISPPVTPANKSSSRPPHSRRRSHSSPTQKSKRLTEGACLPSQNTPPQTPRALSNEDKSNQTHPSQTHGGTPLAKSQSQDGSTAGSVIGSPKGKLSVMISEARALRPAVDPYVVCQFQWNEYISRGPKGEETLGNGLAKRLLPRRSEGDAGRPMAIPMKSRQSSNTSIIDSKDTKLDNRVADPKWDHEAIFDVVGDHAELDISVYERSDQEAFLGHVRFCPSLVEYDSPLDQWFQLEPREGDDVGVTGEIHLRIKFEKIEKKSVGPEDFQILKLIGKGTFGQVFQVRKKDTQRIYAMKVLSKKVIIQKKEVAHTIGERNILVRTATAESPFIVGLKFSFQTPSDLYLVTDYMSGGELFWHLQKEGKFHEARAKFYIAELILALQHLHQNNVVYRDLKPENILLDANGHIALCDFGLSKANLTKDTTTNTFCGTTEYLAPEVLLDEQGYGTMVDFWSLGVLVFEMCCGWSPFYAEDTQQMYKNIAFGKVRFPRDALSPEGRNFVKGLLNRNPKHRLGATDDAEELKRHPFFADIEWDALAKKNLVPPFKPKLKSETDTSNFDPEFTNAMNGASSLNARAAALASGVDPASTPLSPGVQAKFAGFTFVDESAMDKHFRDRDDLDRMDTRDDRYPESGWDNRRTERMSGIIPTMAQNESSEDGVFNNGRFDI